MRKPMFIDQTGSIVSWKNDARGRCDGCYYYADMDKSGIGNMYCNASVPVEHTAQARNGAFPACITEMKVYTEVKSK